MAGEIFSQAWALYKRFWRHFIPIALVIFVVLSALSLVFALTLGLFGLILAAVLSFVGTFWLQGAIAIAVQDVRDGRADLTIGETLGRVGPRALPLILAGLLAGLIIGIGFLLIIVPGVIALTFLSLIVPVIVLEGAGVMASFGRSFDLVKGHFWQVLIVIVLTVLIAIAGDIVVSVVFLWLPSAGRSFAQSLIVNTVLAPFFAAAWTLMYYRLRGETETEAEAHPVPA